MSPKWVPPDIGRLTRATALSPSPDMRIAAASSAENRVRTLRL
jgi:hypothetical protein